MSLLRNDFPYPGGVSLLFDQPVSQLADLRQAVAMLTAIAAERLRRDRLVARTVTVWLETRYQAGVVAESSSRTIELPVPVNDGRLLGVFTVGAITMLYRPHTFYRAAGVYCGDLTADDTACDRQPVAASGHGRIDHIGPGRGARAHRGCTRIGAIPA